MQPIYFKIYTKNSNHRLKKREQQLIVTNYEFHLQEDDGIWDENEEVHNMIMIQDVCEEKIRGVCCEMSHQMKNDKGDFTKKVNNWTLTPNTIKGYWGININYILYILVKAITHCHLQTTKETPRNSCWQIYLL